LRKWKITLLENPGKPGMVMKRVRVAEKKCNTPNTVEGSMSKPRGNQPRDKNKINQSSFNRRISEIKLKRTDTTLDLSQ
jgi:hypothetical protein